MLQKKFYQPPTVLLQERVLLEDVLFGNSGMDYFEMTFHVEASAQYFEDSYAIGDNWDFNSSWDPTL